MIQSGAAVPSQLFEALGHRLAPELRQAMDHVLMVPEGAQRSACATRKDDPPTATIASLPASLPR